MRYSTLKIWQQWRVAFVTALAFVVLFLMAFFTFNLSFLNPIKRVIQEFSMTDLYWQMQLDMNDYKSSQLITIVDMTELTERADLAMTLEAIESCEPKVIGVDMVFLGLKEDTLGDNMIRDVAATYDNIIWSLKLGEYVDDEVGYSAPMRSFFVEETGCTEAVTMMQRSFLSGVKRKLILGWMLQGELKPSFAGTVVNKYAEREVVPTKDAELNIDFTPTKFTVVPWDSVLQNSDLIADRIVLFGAMHEDADMHVTPLGTIAGLELLAYAVQTKIKEHQVNEVDGALLWCISFLIVALTYWGRSLRKRWIDKRRRPEQRLILGFPIIGSLISFIWIAVITLLAYILFSKYEISFNLGYAFSAIAFLGTAESSYNTILDYIKEKINEKAAC